MTDKNEGVSMQRPSKPSAIPWTAATQALLGKLPDRQVSIITGKKLKTVKAMRLGQGIPPAPSKERRTLSGFEKQVIRKECSLRASTQSDLAIRFRVDPSTISRIANGCALDPKILERESLERLDKAWADSSRNGFGIWTASIRGPYDEYRRLVWRDLISHREGVLTQTKNWQELDAIAAKLYQRVTELRSQGNVKSLPNCSAWQRPEAKTA